MVGLAGKKTMVLEFIGCFCWLGLTRSDGLKFSLTDLWKNAMHGMTLIFVRNATLMFVCGSMALKWGQAFTKCWFLSKLRIRISNFQVEIRGSPIQCFVFALKKDVIPQHDSLWVVCHVKQRGVWFLFDLHIANMCAKPGKILSSKMAAAIHPPSTLSIHRITQADPGVSDEGRQ